MLRLSSCLKLALAGIDLILELLDPQIFASIIRKPFPLELLELLNFSLCTAALTAYFEQMCSASRLRGHL